MTMQAMAVTYPELDGYREVVDSDFLLDGISSGDTRKINVCRLDDAFFALNGLDELLCEAKMSLSVLAID